MKTVYLVCQSGVVRKPTCYCECASHYQSVEQLQLLQTCGVSSASCRPNSCHSACMLPCGTTVGSGDRMAKKEKSSVLGISGVW